jgi:hypothetical protein
MWPFRSFVVQGKAQIRLSLCLVLTLSLPVKILTLPTTTRACSSQPDFVWRSVLRFEEARITSLSIPDSRQGLRRTLPIIAMQSIIRRSSLGQKIGRRRGPEWLRARPTMTHYRAAFCGTSHSVLVVVLSVMAGAMATAAMATVANTLKETEAAVRIQGTSNITN